VGGELFARQHTEQLDIGQVRMRLEEEGLQAYGALLANGCIRLYSSVSAPSEKREDDDKDNTTAATSNKKLRKRLAYDGFFLFVVFSVLSGSYTTVVFTLLPLYSKTRLGPRLRPTIFAILGCHSVHSGDGLYGVSVQSGAIRTSLCLVLVHTDPGRRKRMLVTPANIICAASFWEWTKVVKLASQFLFPSGAEAND
jgi:hypothetical protein